MLIQEVDASFSYVYLNYLCFFEVSALYVADYPAEVTYFSFNPC